VSGSGRGSARTGPFVVAVLVAAPAGVKPDFEGKVFAADGRFVRSFVVEVMGFDQAVYRAKKQHLKELCRVSYYAERA